MSQDYRDVLDGFTYAPDEKIKHRALNVEALDYESNRDLVNEIVFYKFERYT